MVSVLLILGDSFMGIFGLYYSLQYLSLSDATVLQFLSPMFTALGGAIFLHEPFALRELLAGCARGHSLCLMGAKCYSFAVVSLIGVVLIARPQFLFGVNSNETPRPPDDLMKRVLEVTPVQRLTAVGYGILSK